MSNNQTDNKPLELLAKNCIANKLMKLKFLVSDPFFDIKGSDLLIMTELSTKVKLGIIQSKGRRVKEKQNSNVTIHKEYLKENFILFIYIEKEIDYETEYLYCYFSEDVKKWKFNDKYYILNIPVNFEKNKNFIPHKYSTEKAERIKEIMLKQDFDLNQYLNQASILDKVFTSWKEDCTYPSPIELKYVYEEVEFYRTTLRQKIFIYFSYCFNNRELEYLVSSDYTPIVFDFLLSPISKNQNTTSPILAESNIRKVSFLKFGNLFGISSFSKFIIAEMEIEVNSKGTTGVFCFVRDSEGEGVEMFLPKKENVFPSVKHYSLNSKERAEDILQIIEKKYM